MKSKIIRGKVVKGAGRGKKLGIPTINLAAEEIKNLEEGIYVCRINEPFSSWGVLHFGPRPTFGEKDFSFEIFLFDFDSKLKVPKSIEVEIYKFIREIRKFKSVNEMMKEIDKDILFAKNFISKLGENF